MKVIEAAVKVLKAAGRPLRAGEITERILAQGLWTPGGKTPEATVAAGLYVDIKKRGDASPFEQTGKGVFGLKNYGAETTPEESVSTPEPIPATRPEAQGDGKKVNNNRRKHSFIESAEMVLERFGNQRPMHYRAITEKALELEWLATEGKTPDATMYAQILTDIKRALTRGELPGFVQHGRGMVSLARWIKPGLAMDIEHHNKKVRKALHQRLLEMPPEEFEELTARLFAEIGFDDIEVTKRSNDGGIDVRGTLVVGEVIRTRMAIQVKKWNLKHSVHAPVVQQVRGSLGAHEQGLIVTTSDFSSGARKEAARPDAVPVALMNGEQLVLLLCHYGIGVSRKSHDVFELEEGEHECES